MSHCKQRESALQKGVDELSSWQRQTEQSEANEVRLSDELLARRTCECCRHQQFAAGRALEACSHATFQALLRPLLLPCLETVLTNVHESSAADTAAAFHNEPQNSSPGQGGSAAVQILNCGSAWAMLGMLRLHLTAPPAGADPVGKYAYKKAHVERVLSEDVLPEAKVRALTGQ